MGPEPSQPAACVYRNLTNGRGPTPLAEEAMADLASELGDLGLEASPESRSVMLQGGHFPSGSGPWASQPHCLSSWWSDTWRLGPGHKAVHSFLK